MTTDSSAFPRFEAAYAPDDALMAARFLEAGALSREQDARIDATARRLIAAIRANDDRFGGVEDMLREFALSTKEGLAPTVLVEALLRVPDAAPPTKLHRGRSARATSSITKRDPAALPPSGRRGARHVGRVIQPASRKARSDD